MFESITNFFKKLMKSEKREPGSKDAAKERLHLVLMQDRANVSADFLELMKQEIIEVIKKYIEVDEKEIDVRLTNKENEDGTNGAPALYANIPILNIKNEMKKEVIAEKANEVNTPVDIKTEDTEVTAFAEVTDTNTKSIEENKEQTEATQTNVGPTYVVSLDSKNNETATNQTETSIEDNYNMGQQTENIQQISENNESNDLNQIEPLQMNSENNDYINQQEAAGQTTTPIEPLNINLGEDAF